MPERIVVAMSGGVDSSVAAALLVQQGHQIIGMMMRLWSEPGLDAYNRCCTPDAMAGARRVAAILGIPFYAVDAQEVFRQKVVSYFLEGYQAGITPNPCLVCNRQIRWEFLLKHARSVGAQAMATGHYVRLHRDKQGGYQLLRAVDSNKDQSYVLHVLNQEQLSQASFPLGSYTKNEIRQLAHEFQLPVAERADSQDLCFIGKDDYREFLKRNADEEPQAGPIYNIRGEMLGEHRGLAYYTIGQRKNIGVTAAQPLYVMEKDTTRNALIVGYRNELGSSELTTAEVNWVSGQARTEPFRALVKIRYKAADAHATITPMADGGVQIHFDEPLVDITPGQAAVFYDGDVCLGGGIIRRRGTP